jgi:hypothetical protein
MRIFDKNSIQLKTNIIDLYLQLLDRDIDNYKTVLHLISEFHISTFIKFVR